MKKVIFACLAVVLLGSCTKSVIRTCNVTLQDGTKRIYFSTIELKRSEIANYEKGMMQTYDYKDIKCK
jgi:hypothetical protein